MNSGRSVSAFASLLLALVFLVCLFPTSTLADQSTTSATTPLAQANEAKAREHYLAGDAALRSGDPLTAVVEWETALRLKPSSKFTAKMLPVAAAKLGDVGAEAYAHYVNAIDLQSQGKLDDAGKELGLAMSYQPGGMTPQCLTAKTLELADLQKAIKPAATSMPKAASTATVAKKTTTSTKKPSTSTAKKATSTTKSTKTSAAKTTHTPTYHPPKPYYPPVHRTKLSYVHGHSINGKYVPGHYTIKSSRPVALPPPP